MDEEGAKKRCFLAIDYITGKKVPRDPVTAAILFKQVADAGYPNGMFGLAELMYRGEGIAKDEERAFRYYESAAVTGHPASLFRLGTIMAIEGPHFDLERSREYFEKCVSLGLTMADVALGDLYFDGRGVEPDPKKALEHYLTAANGGDPLGMMRCGYMYEFGFGTEIDEKTSCYFYTKAAAEQIPEAMIKVAQLAYDGKIPGGKEESIRWYSRCAEMGYVSAMVNLGTIYYEGDGVQVDFEKAFSLYSAAAEAGDADAMFMVGRMYTSGMGVEADPAKGFEAFNKAAACGHELAIQIIENIRRKQNQQIIEIKTERE